MMVTKSEIYFRMGLSVKLCVCVRVCVEKEYMQIR